MSRVMRCRFRHPATLMRRIGIRFESLTGGGEHNALRHEVALQALGDAGEEHRRHAELHEARRVRRQLRLLACT